MKSKGIYVLANDVVYDQLVALVHSIRLNHSQDIPICIIPYDSNMSRVKSLLTNQESFTIFDNKECIQWFTTVTTPICEVLSLRHPNRLYKMLSWFGPFDEFIYIDVDCLVLNNLDGIFSYLDKYDFISCDFQYRRGIRYVFYPGIHDVFTQTQLNQVFNSVFFCSRRLWSRDQFIGLITSCLKNKDYLDFSECNNQPILNYLVLSHVKRYINPCKRGFPGSWAGTTGYIQRGHHLYDREIDKQLLYLHWAGIKMVNQFPYRQLWELYRFIDEPRSSVLMISKTDMIIYRFRRFCNHFLKF